MKHDLKRVLAIVWLSIISIGILCGLMYAIIVFPFLLVGIGIVIGSILTLISIEYIIR